MRVIITGGTGLIGRALVQVLAREEDETIVLSRAPARAVQLFQQQDLSTVRVVGWDARTVEGWGELLNAECALVNLAGATPAHWRWTAAYRKEILESRLRAGRALLQAIERYGPPALLVQASASGYYGDRQQELLPETSPPGCGFRAEVCQQWEAITASVPTRRCIIRTGLVLDAQEGAFPPLLLFARLCGRQLGSGEQWLPWIHREDVARAISFLLRQRALAGAFNLCAPEAVTSRECIREIQRLLKRPSLFPLPAFVLRAALGELASVVLDSQHLLPKRLLEAGFAFSYPRFDEALRQVLQGEGADRIERR